MMAQPVGDGHDSSISMRDAEGSAFYSPFLSTDGDIGLTLENLVSRLSRSSGYIALGLGILGLLRLIDSGF